MAWYLRKSVSIGPVRFNLSKSGIGTSVGVKGFRVGVRPNGKSYIHAGRYGLYYRQELGSGSEDKGTTPQISSQTYVEPPKPGTIEYTTASSQELIPQSRKELLGKLNQSYSTVRLDYMCGVIAFFPALIAFLAIPLAGWIVSLFGVAAFILVARWESKRRTIVLDYDFEDKGEHFQKIISSFNALASNSKVWSMINSRQVFDIHESKRNAGAGNLISRTEAQVGEGKPPWVETNIDVPVIKTRGQSLYMMPDGILVYDSKGVGFVEYDDIRMEARTTRFIEEQPPHDAKVVDKTWKHPNKSGGPDKRFKSNYQIPICLYGELRVKSASGMDLYLMTSKNDAPQNFSTQFSSVYGAA